MAEENPEPHIAGLLYDQIAAFTIIEGQIMNADIYLDNRGSWQWEVVDGDGVYLRSDRHFDSQAEALRNLREETHLLNPTVRLN
ncbi:hypothetical protein [Sphingomonas sp.]|uniref:hypothetical protein n=1 Tax=Sphingomonas sp. TaxID=28214 RepID=UPI002FD9D93D